MTPPLRVALAVIAVAVPSHASGQMATDGGRAPTLTIERYPEDWSWLADPERRTGRWTEQFKYVPLDEGKRIYVTTGMEARSRYEVYENVNWGSAPDDEYVWHRLMPYADVHVGKVQFFAQPIVTAVSGLARSKRGVDSTGVDLLQAFAEVEIDVRDDASLRVTAGRKMLALGAGRFVDNRYGPNVPRAFDGVDARLVGSRGQVVVMYFQPVDNSIGDFDDSTSRQRAMWGVYATRWLRGSRSNGFDLFYLGYRDRNAVYDQGAGHLVAHTFGARVFGESGGLYWNVEAALQRGRFAGGRVEAWGAGGQLGRRFRDAPWRPEIGLEVDAISGDADPGDRDMGTHNPMFPAGRYFGTRSAIGPRNIVQVRPSAAVHPAKGVSVSLTGVGYWRESRGDGVYSLPGILVRSGRGSDARFVGKQLEVAVAWQVTPELNLSASVNAFAPGPFVRETGPARVMRTGGAMANFRF